MSVLYVTKASDTLALERAVTITNISQSLPHIVAEKVSWHRCGMNKLRHCHRTYTSRPNHGIMRRKHVANGVLSDDACRQLWGTGARAPVHFQ